MKKPTFIIGGIIVSVLLLASAAFVGARLVNGQTLSRDGLNLFSSNGGSQRVQINNDDIQPSTKLPQTPADIWSLYDHRKDNSIFVGIGNVTVDVQTDRSGNVETSSKYDGPILEVIVTSQTTIYEDVTMQQFNDPPPDGQKIQQVVEPGTLDGLGAFSTIAVWGKETGNRIIADVLVYESPALLKK
jgi:hypothetical protein